MNGNIANTALLDRLFTDHRFEAVMHFASFIQVGESVEKPAKYYGNNVTAGLALLGAMQDADVRRIVFEGDRAVGDRARQAACGVALDRMSGAIPLRRERGRFSVPLTSRHHRPCHPGELVGQRDGCDLGRSPRQQCREPRPMRGAMDLGIANDSERASHEQAAQIAVALFADTAEPVPATT